MVEWLNPVNGAITAGPNVSGGSASQSFTPFGSFTSDAVLYLHNQPGI
jgi:hypothetical protein